MQELYIDISRLLAVLNFPETNTEKTETVGAPKGEGRLKSFLRARTALFESIGGQIRDQTGEATTSGTGYPTHFN